MTDKRTLLYILLAFIGFMLWQQWSQEHAPKIVTKPNSSQSADNAVNNDLPPDTALAHQSAGKQAADSMPAAHHDTSDQLVTIKTDVLLMKIDPKGGNVVEADLRKFPKVLHQPDVPEQILSYDPAKLYLAQSGLLSKTGPDTRKGQTTYRVSGHNFDLADGENTVSVDLIWSQAGVDVTKRFTLKRGDYAVDVQYLINNKSNKDWRGNFYAQIRRKLTKAKKNGFFGLNTYRGAAISSAEKPYQKIPYKKMDKEDLSKDITGGWLAMQQRYFLSAWVPDQQDANHYFSRVSPNKTYTIGYIGPAVSVKPGAKSEISNKLYVGPELEEPLAALAPHLELTIDYGWLWIISSAIFWVMKHIYALIGNWGWSIVLVTFLIKVLFYKLSEKSYVSMAKMRVLQPRMEQLKKRHGDDKQKLSKATMEMYKKEKINPLGGCLPMVIQIPVFIALYYVLIESVQLRHAPFVFWIQDLSSKDPYGVLPLLMGASMFAQQFLNPPPADKAQEIMMRYGLPVMFTVLFWNFPSGLVLYWLVNNVLSILQQWYIMRKHA